MKTCVFCEVETPDEDLIVGEAAQLCRACLGLAFEQTLASAGYAPPQIPEADIKCAWCAKPAPRHQCYSRGEGDAAFGICAACVSRCYTVATRVSELSAHRKRYWSHVGEGTTRELVTKHFARHNLSTDDLVTTSRNFAVRLRVDLQQALHQMLDGDSTVCVGFMSRWSHETADFTSLVAIGGDVKVGPLQWQQIDVGEDEPVRCAKRALWLGQDGKVPYAVLVTGKLKYGCLEGLVVEIATPAGEVEFANTCFRHVEQAITDAPTYRGKILSLEVDKRNQGIAGDVSVHRLDPVSREQVILPAPTIDLLERNVFGFVARRPALRKVGMPTKKGLLFYGPPGTGKTHTIRFLMSALPEHTTLLVTAEQVGLIDEYVSLARLLAPSVLVIEDVDLIARDREDMATAIQESLLNRLLNEMDGLREDAEILFVLTTNRPEALEAALASRPGRVDQAIEFPLPDAEGRLKLIRLYARGMELADGVLEHTVERTDGVSAAFIKELMRRSAQYVAERGDDRLVATNEDVNLALDEMLFQGGTLNAKLLGGRVE